ncbi:unnamed protein product [Tenebrio molitor]|nr:unnamed protein product [Tenebrio molitor]
MKFVLEVEEPSQELLNWAKDNIGENSDTKSQIISDLRDMIYSRGECTPPRTDDSFLLRFLRSRKFHLEAAYKLFVSYNDFREENRNLYEGVGLDPLIEMTLQDIMHIPPYKDQTGKRMIIYKFGNWDPDISTVEEMLQATLFVLELGGFEPSIQMKGVICVMDLQNISMRQALYLTPNVAQKIVEFGVTSHPTRVDVVHVINHSWALEMLLTIFKPFLHGKIKKKIYFHRSNESLHEHINPKYLPETYGGTQPNLDNNHWFDDLSKYETVRKELRSLGYDPEIKKKIANRNRLEK